VGWYRYEAGKLVPIEEVFTVASDDINLPRQVVARGYNPLQTLGDIDGFSCQIFRHKDREEWLVLLADGELTTELIVTSMIELFDLVSRFSPVLNLAYLYQIREAILDTRSRLHPEILSWMR
jgi:hypothetical protein